MKISGIVLLLSILCNGACSSDVRTASSSIKYTEQLAILSCQGNSVEKAFSVPHNVQPVLSEAQPLMEIEPIIKRDMDEYSSAPATNTIASTDNRYFYDRLDLNSDGVCEILVWIHGPSFGGSSGYTLQIYQETSAEFKRVYDTEGVWNPVIVNDERVNGWKSLIILTGGGGKPRRWVKIDFDGASYRDLEDIHNKVLQEDELVGIAYIADNWWEHFRGIPL